MSVAAVAAWERQRLARLRGRHRTAWERQRLARVRGWRRLGAPASRPPARRRRAHPGHLHLQWEKGAGGMRGNGASGRLARPLRPVWEHCGAIAIAGDRHELRSTLAPPGSAGVSPACAPEARAPRLSGRPPSPFTPCGSIAGRSQSRATDMNFGRRWRRLGARVSPACAPEARAPRVSGRPPSPFAPCGRRGQGGCGATARRSNVITVCVALPHEWLAD
jgi:hypothetical protein